MAVARAPAAGAQTTWTRQAPRPPLHHPSPSHSPLLLPPYKRHRRLWYWSEFLYGGWSVDGWVSPPPARRAQSPAPPPPYLASQAWTRAPAGPGGCLARRHPSCALPSLLGRGRGVEWDGTYLGYYVRLGRDAAGEISGRRRPWPTRSALPPPVPCPFIPQPPSHPAGREGGPGERGERAKRSGIRAGGMWARRGVPKMAQTEESASGDGSSCCSTRA